MPTKLSDIGNKAKRTELYRKQKGDKKAEQRDRRKRRAREAQELGEVGLCLSYVLVCTSTAFHEETNMTKDCLLERNPEVVIFCLDVRMWPSHLLLAPERVLNYCSPWLSSDRTSPKIIVSN